MPADFERRYNTQAAAAWLSERLGFTIRPKTLTNLRALGKGPQGWLYYGQRPTIVESALRAYAEQALQSEPTSRRKARIRQAAANSTSASAQAPSSARLPVNYRTSR